MAPMDQDKAIQLGKFCGKILFGLEKYKRKSENEAKKICENSGKRLYWKRER